MNLREIFAPLFTYVLYVTRTPVTRPRSKAEIRQEIDKQLEKQLEQVTRYALSQTDYEMARFAIVAWIDELILRSAANTNNQALSFDWQQDLLQVKIDFHANAGNEFFDRLGKLDRLSAGSKEVREIYYLCLSFGFRGSHMNDSPETLLELRRAYSQTLPVAPADIFELERKREHITPQPYEVPVPPPRPRPKQISPLWLGVPAILAAVLLIYLLIPTDPCGNKILDPGEQCDFALAGQCPGGLSCQQNCTCPPDPMGEVNRIVQGLQCAQVSARNDNGVILLEGHVQSEAQRQQALQAVRGVANVKDARGNLTILEWPFCQVVQILTPFRTQTESAGVSLSISPQRGCGQVYRAKEKPVINVTSSKELQYIYIDYYAADKQFVIHMAPNPKTDQGNFYPNTTTFTPNGKWEISEPFGQELITIIASPQPLFAEARPDILKNGTGISGEYVNSYLSDLEQKLQTAPSAAAISAALCFITSEK